MLITLAATAFAGQPQSAPAQAPRTQPDLTPLIDQIAHGTPDEAAAACDELVRQVVDPLAAALKSLEQRPPAEQRRLLEALGRIGAVLRMRLYRAGLPTEDAQLFDEFAARDRDLLEKLFDDDPRLRLAALYQIPLEPGTAAGVLVTSRLSDWDASVIEAALKTATRMADDPVTIRGLTRFIESATRVVCSGRGALPPDEALVWTDFSRKAIHLLGDARATASVPVIVDAIRCFGRPPHRASFYVAESLEALGKIGDERAVPLLLESVEDREQHAVRSLGPGVLFRETVGDAALLALTRIYGLPAEALGFVSTPAGDRETAVGFTEERTRRTAQRAFALWYKENGEKAPQERKPLTIQSAPTTEPAGDAPAEQP